MFATYAKHGRNKGRERGVVLHVLLDRVDYIEYFSVQAIDRFHGSRRDWAFSRGSMLLLPDI